jgi:hypothetical protein
MYETMFWLMQANVLINQTEGFDCRQGLGMIIGHFLRQKLLDIQLLINSGKM